MILIKKMKKKQQNLNPKSQRTFLPNYLLTEISNVEGHISFTEKNYIEFRDLERFNEGVLIEKAVKTTIQILYDKVLFDKYNNADEALKDYQLFERRRPN